jgi:hypothetical protein
MYFTGTAGTGRKNLRKCMIASWLRGSKKCSGAVPDRNGPIYLDRRGVVLRVAGAVALVLVPDGGGVASRVGF